MDKNYILTALGYAIVGLGLGIKKAQPLSYSRPYHADRFCAVFYLWLMPQIMVE